MLACRYAALTIIHSVFSALQATSVMHLHGICLSMSNDLPYVRSTGWMFHAAFICHEQLIHVHLHTLSPPAKYSCNEDLSTRI